MSSGKNLEFIVMLLIDYKKSVKYDALGFIPKTFGTEGVILESV
jgi:hypothetical protein